MGEGDVGPQSDTRTRSNRSTTTAYAAICVAILAESDPSYLHGMSDVEEKCGNVAQQQLWHVAIWRLPWLSKNSRLGWRRE